MKYIEASQFGGPEVLTVVEKETPTPAEGELLVEVQAAGIHDRTPLVIGSRTEVEVLRRAVLKTAEEVE